MSETLLQQHIQSLEVLGIKGAKNVFWNLTPEELVEHSIRKGMGQLADSGALVIHTGEFTGRSPEDRFIVRDNTTEKKVHWGKVNIPFEGKKFDQLWRKACSYLRKKDVYARDVQACASADDLYHMRIRLITEYPWSNQFASNMFLRPDRDALDNFDPHWTVLI